MSDPRRRETKGDARTRERAQGSLRLLRGRYWALVVMPIAVGSMAACNRNPAEEPAQPEAELKAITATAGPAVVTADAAIAASTPSASAPDAGATTSQTVWVVMKDSAPRAQATGTNNWNTRGANVHNALTSTASQSQSSLRAALVKKGVKHKSFCIVNAMKVEADQATIDEIAKRSDVARIVKDHKYSIPPLQPAGRTPGPASVEWGLTSIRAPEAWNTFGVKGEDIVVANVDTGVQFDHSALNRQYRGTQAGGTYDHNYNWFDPAAVCNSPSNGPCDNVGHGTHTMGTMVGDDGDPGTNQIGVAPHARWIAAKGCESNWCSTESLLASAQWILAPTDLNGQNPRPDLRPHVVNNSWGGGSGDTFYQAAVQAWVDAGIFPAFSNGNSGSSCGRPIRQVTTRKASPPAPTTKRTSSPTSRRAAPRPSTSSSPTCPPPA